MPAPYYAYSRALDPVARDVVLAGASWAGGQPLMERVVRIVTTQRGSYAPDKTLGVDFKIIQKAGANVQTAWKREVEAALARLTRAPAQLIDLGVGVDPPKRGRLLYAVAFRDPRDTTRTLQKLRLAA